MTAATNLRQKRPSPYAPQRLLQVPVGLRQSENGVFDLLGQAMMKAKMIKPVSQLAPLLQETDELVAILFTRVETVKKKKGR